MTHLKQSFIEELETMNFEDRGFQRYLSKNNIKAEKVDHEYDGVYKYMGTEESLKKMIDKYWAVDSETAEEMEEWYSLIETK
jgi:hypothetical protein